MVILETFIFGSEVTQWWKPTPNLPKKIKVFSNAPSGVHFFTLLILIQLSLKYLQNPKLSTFNK